MSEEGQLNSLLIIGDMIIDDSWLVGHHSSPTATHVGRNHYRSLHHPGSAVKQHCGAGRVAGILRQASIGDATNRTHFCKSVSVLGVWATGDTDGYLTKMFEPANLMGSNNYRVVPPNANSAPDRIRLLNLGKILEDKTVAELRYTHFTTPTLEASDDIRPFIAPTDIAAAANPSDKYFGTTRVYRLYRRMQNRLEQLGRLDWELSPHYLEGQNPSWLPNKLAKKDAETVANLLFNEIGADQTFDAVIIKDHGKGVVSRTLLELLVNHDKLQPLNLKNVPWFIHTKLWEPFYLEFLRDNVELRLLVYHSVALHHSDVATWVTHRKEATPDAIEKLLQLDELCKKPTNRRLTVIMPGAFNAIALERETKDSKTLHKLLLQPLPNPNNVPLEGTTGDATAMFSSLVYGMLQPASRNVFSSFLLDGALRVAQEWAGIEYHRLLNAETLRAPQELVLSLIGPNQTDKLVTEKKLSLLSLKHDAGKLVRDDTDLKSVGNVQVFGNLEDMKNRWKESSDNTCCAISLDCGKNEHYIELSRSSIELQGYVCRAPKKREQIASLIRTLDAFDPRDRSASGIILSKPGSGKTRLVESLARDRGFQLLRYNITNMVCFDDLLMSFDQIVTAQLEQRDKRILVFVDEINAQIERQHVYEAFLTPLEDGYYIRSGTKRFIKPCAWLFVGTGGLEDIQAQTKGSDFTSRLSMDPIQLSSVPRDQEAFLYIENIYVGLLAARARFPALVRVDPSVIWVLAAMGHTKYHGDAVEISASNRQISHLIAKWFRVDGLGRGRWANYEKVRQEYRSVLVDSTLDVLKNNYKDQWIRVYDVHPDFIGK